MRPPRGAAPVPALRRTGGEDEDGGAADLVRRALVETISRGDRLQLIRELDESLLGVRAKPAGRVAHAIAS